MRLNSILHKVIESDWSSNMCIASIFQHKIVCFYRKRNKSFSQSYSVKFSRSGQRTVRLVNRTSLCQVTVPMQKKCSGISEYVVISNPTESLSQQAWAFAHWNVLLTLWPSISTVNSFSQCISFVFPIYAKAGHVLPAQTSILSILDLFTHRIVTSTHRQPAGQDGQHHPGFY